MRVGVPRSLSFYYLFPFIRSFLNELGVLWLESPRTNERDLTCLDLCPTDEPCVSVKVAFAHAKNLLDWGADVLLVPTVVSLSETAYCCPKMIGLPSMLKAGLGLEDSQVLCPSIDLKDNPKSWRESWIDAARKLGIFDRGLANRALDRGLKAWRDTERYASSSNTPVCEMIEGAVDPCGVGYERVSLTSIEQPESFSKDSAQQVSNHWTTGVMGHAYILHDMFGKKVMKVLGSYGSLITAEEVPAEDVAEAIKEIPDGDKAWTIEGRILGAALHLLRHRKVDRMVFVAAFSCGPASIIENYIAEEAESRGIPLLNLAVDEHSGDAGLVTRLEAFMDSVRPSVLPEQGTGDRTAVHEKTEAGCETAGREKAGAGDVTAVHEKAGAVADSKDAVSAEAALGSGRDSSVRIAARASRSRPQCSRPSTPLGLVNLGNLGIALEAMFDYMKIPLIRAPQVNEDMASAGKELAPEFICSPMVNVLGQVRYLADRGVDRILMVQGKGRCRLGWYSQVMQTIMDRAGYNIRLLAVDSPFPWRDKGAAFLEAYQDIAGGTGVPRALGGLSLAVRKLAVMDRAADILREVRARESVRGQGDRRYERFLQELGEARSLLSVERTLIQFARDVRKIPVEAVDPIKVMIVGEIYVVNEPFASKDAEKILGSLEERVRVYNNLGISEWVNYHLLKTPRAVKAYRQVASAAAPYLRPDVGGHGRESVGETVLSKARGIDGVVHLFPFTCMPEIIAQNVLVRVSNELDIPVLSLMISEQTAFQGLTTRLEAFCDLLAGRRKRAQVR